MPGLGDLQKPKGDSENIHPAYRTGRNMIGRSLERSQATGTGLRWLSGRTSHVNRALEPPDPESRGYLDEFTGSFTHSLTAANYDMLGSAVEAAGILMGDEQGAVFARTGYEMQVRSQGFDTGKPGSVHSWSEVKDVDTALRFLIGGAGQGLGSTVPSLVTGTLGALAGGRLRGRTGATIGSLAGAALPSYALNLGEAFRQFKEEGVDQKSAAGWAVGMAVPILRSRHGGALQDGRRAQQAPEARDLFAHRAWHRAGHGGRRRHRMDAVGHPGDDGCLPDRQPGTSRHAPCAPLTRRPSAR